MTKKKSEVKVSASTEDLIKLLSEKKISKDDFKAIDDVSVDAKRIEMLKAILEK